MGPSPPGGAQELVGGAGLAQRPVALGHLGVLLGIQQGLAAGGHPGGHGGGCGDNGVVGVPTSSPHHARLHPGHPRAGGKGEWWGAVLGCFGRVSGVFWEGFCSYQVVFGVGQKLKRVGNCLGRVVFLWGL